MGNISMSGFQTFFFFRKQKRICNIPGEVPYLSEAESLAKAARASGKLGGVAGVLAGVHNLKKKKRLQKLEGIFWH